MQQKPATALVNVDNGNSIAMREQLMREINSLESKLKQLKLLDDGVDYSLEQTYREMIHSRREMLVTMPGTTLF
ncbi:MAG: hypothetical protein GYB33_17840 [Gammaproteobacteria bacterium]|nr:hypothetical protein [Gammaproteobacteria bacterium]